MDVIAMKVMAASVAFVLVGLQALLMCQVYGKMKLAPLASKTLQAWHRRQGHVLAVLFLAIGYLCVTQASVNWSDWRVVAHATFASLTLLALASKVLILRVFPRAMKYVTGLGITLFLSAVAAIGTSVPWYLYLWLVRGVRPY